jgi:Spy/CpxP family protein refolding chaperone
MRNICLIVFAGVLLTGVDSMSAQDNSSQAQQFSSEAHHRPMDVDSELAHLTRELDLTPDQQAKIRPLLVEHQEKERALHQDQSLSPEELRSRAHAISDETHKKIEVFLTDEQKQKAKAMRQRMHQNDRKEAPSSPQGWADPSADVA